MKLEYIGRAVLQSKFGNLSQGTIIEVEDSHSAVILELEDKNGNKLFKEVSPKKEDKPKRKKRKMIIEEDGV